MAPSYLIKSPLPGSSTIVLPSSTPASLVLPSLCSALDLPPSFAADLRLSRNGQPWDGTVDEAELGLEWVQGEVGMRIRGGAPKKRCQNGKGSVTETQCPQPAIRLVGDCPHCELQFCARHRLPEDHACTKMNVFKEKAFERNKAKLESERTVGSKMVGA